MVPAGMMPFVPCAPRFGYCWKRMQKACYRQGLVKQQRLECSDPATPEAAKQDLDTGIPVVG